MNNPFASIIKGFLELYDFVSADQVILHGRISQADDDIELLNAENSRLNNLNRRLLTQIRRLEGEIVIAELRGK